MKMWCSSESRGLATEEGLTYVAFEAVLSLKPSFVWVMIMHHHLVQISGRAVRLQFSIEADDGFAT